MRTACWPACVIWLVYFGLRAVLGGVIQPPLCSISYEGSSISYSCPYVSTAVGIDKQQFGQCTSATISCISDVPLACYLFPSAIALHEWSAYSYSSPKADTVLGGNEGLSGVVFLVQSQQIEGTAYIGTRADDPGAVNVTLEFEGA